MKRKTPVLPSAKIFSLNNITDRYYFQLLFYYYLLLFYYYFFILFSVRLKPPDEVKKYNSATNAIFPQYLQNSLKDRNENIK